MISYNDLPDNWLELETMEGLETVEKVSFERPVILFKHSRRCGISAFAKERLGELKIDDSFEFYYLDLLSYREISNEIARRFGVIHQSPQVVVLKEGKASFTTSHHQIGVEVIMKNIK